MLESDHQLGKIVLVDPFLGTNSNLMHAFLVKVCGQIPGFEKDASDVLIVQRKEVICTPHLVRGQPFAIVELLAGVGVSACHCGR